MFKWTSHKYKDIHRIIAFIYLKISCAELHISILEVQEVIQQLGYTTIGFCETDLKVSHTQSLLG